MEVFVVGFFFPPLHNICWALFLSSILKPESNSISYYYVYSLLLHQKNKKLLDSSAFSIHSEKKWKS